MLNRRAIEARLLEKARLEPTFRRKLIAEPARTIAQEFGVEIPSTLKLRVLEETGRELYLVLPQAMPVADLTPRETGAVVGGVRAEQKELEEAEKKSDPNDKWRGFLGTAR